MFVSIENGSWAVYDENEECLTFALADLQGLRAYFEAVDTTEVLCSSSVDYPEGVPENFDGRECLAWALSWDLDEEQELN